jgi:hypothetical protein
MISGIWLGQAIDTLYPAAMDWVHHPSGASKRALFDAYEALPSKAKQAYDADVERAFRGQHGSKAVVYRYKIRGDTSGASVSPVKPDYLDPSLYRAYEMDPGDALVHYAQDEMPLGGKAFGHENEIILRPGAQLKEVKVAYSYDRRMAAKALNLSHYGLEGLPKGEPTVLYHGTTKLFRRFDMTMSRDELVDRFYGKGIFLTPSKRVAGQYADANRNIGFDRSLISDLKRKNPKAGWFMELVYKLGSDAWELAAKEAGFWNDSPAPGKGAFDLVGFTEFLGVPDPNAISSVAVYILGAKDKPLGSDDTALSLFNTSTGAPSWLYDELDELGLNSKVYRPKIYTVVARVSNTLVTASKSQATGARSKGYDSVIYHGSDLVGGSPEVAIFDPKNVRITKIEIV